MLNRFGLWYLASLAPAVALLQTMIWLAPLDRPLVVVLSIAVTIGVLPILPVIMLAANAAWGVDTDTLLPSWYRRLFATAR